MLETGFVTHTEYQKHIRGEWRTIHNLWPHIRKYVPGYGYSRDEIDAMFEGYSGGGKALIDAANVGGLTPGSIPFADALGYLDEDNPNLFWDAANLRLGIGSHPDVALDIEFEAVESVVSRVSAKTRPWRHWECVDGNWGLAIGIDANDDIIHFNYDSPIGTQVTTMMVFDGGNTRVGILDATPLYPFDVGGNTQIQGTFRVTDATTLLGTLGVTGLLSNTGGAKLEIQGGVDGGSTRGIFMWDTTSTSWGIYMSESGAGKSLADGVACTNFAEDVGHHFRFRVADIAGRGFLWENSSEVCLMDLEADTGNLSLAGIFNITKATTLLIDLNPGFTATGEVINITPSAALATEDAEWDGIVIDGAALDPGVIGALIHGLHLDFSTVDMTNEPHIDALHISVPRTSHIERAHCLHTNHGFFMESDLTTLVAGMSPTLINVVVDDVGSTGGDAHILDVASIDGGAASIAAIGTHAGIDVIHQHIGTPTAFDNVWRFNGGWTDVTAECGGVGDIALWEAQDDVVYFGHATTFDEIVGTWATPATKGMHFQFHYSNGAGGWIRFYPTDDTNDAQISGLIRWLASDIPAWATDTVNLVADKYWVRVTRTRLVGTGPTEDTVKFIKGVSYGWDKTGVISALSVSVTDHIALRSNAEIRFYDDGNYVGFEAPALGADQIWVLPSADGDAGDLLQTDGDGNLAWTAAGGATDEKVKVDVAATAGYLGIAGNDGVLRVDATLTYADGGNFVTLGVDSSAIKLDDLGAPDDNTDLDFSTAKHGLVPKGTDVGNFLKDDGTWAAGGGGESNTASNQGSGTSIYYQKSGVDLQFNAIKSENNRLAVALDGTTHDVELTLTEGNINHDALANTHANPYKLDDLAAPDDNTDLDFSTTKHGLVPKGTDAGDYLKDDGTWDTPAGATGPVLIFDSGFDDLALGNIDGKGDYSLWGTWVNDSGADCTAEIVADPGNGRMLRLDDQSAVNECFVSLTLTPAISAEILMGIVEWKVRVSALGASSRGYFNIQDKDIGATEQGGYFRGDSNDIYYRSSGGITAHLVNAVVDTWYTVRTFFDRLGNYTVWWVDEAFEKSRTVMNAGDKFDKLVLSTRDIYSGNVFDIKYVKVWSLHYVA